MYFATQKGTNAKGNLRLATKLSFQYSLWSDLPDLQRFEILWLGICWFVGEVEGFEVHECRPLSELPEGWVGLRCVVSNWLSESLSGRCRRLMGDFLVPQGNHGIFAESCSRSTSQGALRMTMNIPWKANHKCYKHNIFLLTDHRSYALQSKAWHGPHCLPFCLSVGARLRLSGFDIGLQIWRVRSSSLERPSNGRDRNCG